MKGLEVLDAMTTQEIGIWGFGLAGVIASVLIGAYLAAAWCLVIFAFSTHRAQLRVTIPPASVTQNGVSLPGVDSSPNSRAERGAKSGACKRSIGQAARRGRWVFLEGRHDP